MILIYAQYISICNNFMENRILVITYFLKDFQPHAEIGVLVG